MSLHQYYTISEIFPMINRHYYVDNLIIIFEKQKIVGKIISKIQKMSYGIKFDTLSCFCLYKSQFIFFQTFRTNVKELKSQIQKVYIRILIPFIKFHQIKQEFLFQNAEQEWERFAESVDGFNKTNINKDNIMKSWEQMKDLTFVNIKVTKAKSISQGLTKCKIQRLSRNNPVYQHLRIHKKYKKKGNCPVCSPSAPQNDEKYIENSKQEENKPKLKIKFNRRSKTEDLRAKTPVKDSILTPCRTQMSRYDSLNSRIDKIIEETPRRARTPRQQVIEKGERMKKTIQKLDDSVRRSKSYFFHLNQGIQKAEGYFLTSMDDIQLQLNQDKGLSLREVKSDYQKFKEDMNLHCEKMKILVKRKKQLQKPVMFPFNTKEMQNIVNSDTKAKNSETKKIKKIITSLYQYKSNISYSNRMKMVNQIIKKQS